MEIALIVIASLSLVALVILLVVLLTRKPSSQNVSNESLKEFGALSKEIQMLSEKTKDTINLAVTQASAKSSEQNNEKLERFQSNISLSINTRFDALNKQMDEKLAAINKKVDDKLAEGFKGTNEAVTQVRERLQAIDAAQKNIENLSKDVVGLKQVLEGNQSRGQYGEYQLSMVLNNVFGDTFGCYEEQYTLKKVKDGSDVRADAVVFLPEPNKMICIDSKFPFADYQRMFDAESEEEREALTKEFGNAVKKHITVIKDKYIVDGKTAPEAMMFIPNDGVFAFVHHNLQDVVDYAREKKVILTSPSTLPPMLVTINMLRIEVERAKNAKELSKNLSKLSKDFEMFGREWTQFSNALSSTTKHREELDSRVNKISNKFIAIKGSDVSEEVPEIEEEK